MEETILYYQILIVLLLLISGNLYFDIKIRRENSRDKKLIKRQRERVNRSFKALCDAQRAQIALGNEYTKLVDDLKQREVMVTNKLRETKEAREELTSIKRCFDAIKHYKLTVIIESNGMFGVKLPGEVTYYYNYYLTLAVDAAVEAVNTNA